MLIDFDKIEETIIANFYGGEKNTVAKMFVDDMNRIMCSSSSLGPLLVIISMKTAVRLFIF